MEDTVTITKGLAVDNAWVINNVNSNLKSLTVAKLASIGEAQYDALDVQTDVLSSISDKLNIVSDTLDSISEISKMTYPDLAASNSTLATVFTFPSTWTSTDPKSTAVSELIGLTRKMNDLKIDYGGYDAYSFSVNSGALMGVAQGPLVELKSASDSTSGLAIGQMYTIPRTPPAVGVIYLVNNFKDGSIDQNRDITGFAIPKTRQEIFNWTHSVKNLEDSIKVTNSLLDVNTILVENSNPEGKPSNAVNMAVKKVDSFDSVKYVSKNFGTFYAPYPLETMTDLAASSLPTGTIFKNEQGQIGIVNLGQEVLKIKEEELKFFISSPTADQILSWRGEYAEKQVVLSQRSSEQQLFLTELQQKFVYIFNLATDIYKSLTSAQEKIANSGL